MKEIKQFLMFCYCNTLNTIVSNIQIQHLYIIQIMSFLKTLFYLSLCLVPIKVPDSPKVYFKYAEYKNENLFPLKLSLAKVVNTLEKA